MELIDATSIVVKGSFEDNNNDSMGSLTTERDHKP